MTKTKSRTKKNNNNNNHNHNHNNNNILCKDFKAKTQNQEKYLQAMQDSIITVCSGPSGTGKTLMSIGYACKGLVSGQFDKILACRSIVSCENQLGFLPGTVDEKIMPYMIPMLEYFDYFLGPEQTKSYIDEGKILIYPVELIRGHTYHNTCMILSELQNCTLKQVKLFMSRIGKYSKIIMEGDKKQSDIDSLFAINFLFDYFEDVPDMSLITLDKSDIIRHPIISSILEVFEKHNV